MRDPDFMPVEQQPPISLSLPQPTIGQGGDLPAWVLNFTRNDLCSQGHDGEKTWASVSRSKPLASSPVQNQHLQCPWEQCLGKPPAEKQFFIMNQNLCAGSFKQVPWKKGGGGPTRGKGSKARSDQVSGKCAKVTRPSEM